ncbi:glycerol-3-phosphate 1-O-acyltransferase PlsY [Tautonia rosea]|uniref:glycerol-3-phosphate 1-O-acyltransferase PlsY n=1 Tax=Tautonia rosea TaxID=2728037 RepID=UPI0014759E7B|nr:glycerol-3-phosphate 1-O-acyltransferase PlsY [Tautonia rosea]
MTLALSSLAVVLAYLIGSIPFGYLVAKGVKGIDIRTVGSGNVGATNVGRILGFRYFVLVMTLDLLKGLGPTLGFPLLVEAITGQAVPVLAVPVALAAILGHNFSAFLRLRGGKGVATSLGAVIALDPTAALAAAVAFVIVLVITRYVSMSSILGGTVFVIVHFASVTTPISTSDVPLALLIVVLYLMLIYRHRSNLARIRAGTESKVSFGKGKSKGTETDPTRRDGRAWPIVLAIVVLLGGATLGASTLLDADRRAPTLRLGSAELTEVARFRTGHQRAGALTFADEGRLLVVACPRYNRLVLFQVDEDDHVSMSHDLLLHGRPVAVQEQGDRLFVLQRPTADDRHLEAGYWEAFSHDGEPLGSKFRVGWDPDDFAFSPDGRLAYVITSGRSEGGDESKPAPALVVVSVGDSTEDHEIVAQLEFLESDDDPERIILSDTGRFAAVVLARSQTIACVDLSDPSAPVVTGRVPLAAREVPYLSATPLDGDEILMPVDSNRDSLLIPEPPGTEGPLLVTTLPFGSALELVHGRNRRAVGQLPLRGPLNFGTIIPIGLAYSPDRGLLAISDRSGGVRLVAFRELETAALASSATLDSEPSAR